MYCILRETQLTFRIKGVIVAKHEVKIWIPQQMQVGNNDVFFEIRKDALKLGDLRISKGNLF